MDRRLSAPHRPLGAAMSDTVEGLFASRSRLGAMGLG